MAKKDQKVIAIVGALVLALSLLYGIIFSVGFDDYVTEYDFTVPTPALIPNEQSCILQGVNKICNDDLFRITGKPAHKVDPCPPTSSYVNVENGKAILVAYEGETATLEYKKDLKNRDIKVLTQFVVSSASRGGSTTGTFDVSLNNHVSFTDSLEAQEGANRGGASQTRDYIIDLVLDIENPNVYHVQVNGREVKTVEVVDPTIILKFQTRNQGSSCVTPSSVLYVDIIKSRAYFNCKVEDDEVVIRDVFSAGSTFKYQDLTYVPRKICPENYPAIKRSLTEQGARADIQGQLTRKLAMGDSITVNANELIEIYYIADYQEGMGQRCGLDSAYDTATRRCTKVIEEKEDVVEFINQKEFITVGLNQIIFRDSIKIGDIAITSAKPEYTCADEDPKANAPDPRKECWNTVVTTSGQNLIFQYDQERNINPYVTLKYIPKAKFENAAVQSDYQNNFLLTIVNNEALVTSRVQQDKSAYYVKFGSEKKIEFKIKNNLANFDATQSGFQVKMIEQLQFREETEQINVAITKGEKVYSIPIKTNVYGQVIYEIIPFYKIGNTTFFDNEKIIQSHEIVDKTPENVSVVVVNEEAKTGFFDGIVQWFKEIFEALLGWFR